MHYSPAQIIFGLEVVDNPTENFNAASQVAASQGSGQTSFVGGGANVTNVNSNALSAAEAIYLNTNKSLSTVFIDYTGTIALFQNQQILQPPPGSTLPPTSVSNFTFYANGLPITQNEIVSLYNSNDNVLLQIDPAKLGYYLTGKTITAVGKFQ
jgi:hypothetical protein